MFVVCIIGILASIAYPSYQSQLHKIRRTEGQQKLLQLAASLEDSYSKNHSYLTPTPYPILSGEYYHIQIAELSNASYRLTATPILNKGQENDPCGTLSINHMQITGPEASCWE